MFRACHSRPVRFRTMMISTYTGTGHRVSPMLIVMQATATREQISVVEETIREMGLSPHPMPGATRTAIGITGNTGAIDARRLELLPGVMECLRVTKPYKLTGREMHPEDSTIELPQTSIGPKTFTLIAGPCSVENETMILKT